MQQHAERTGLYIMVFIAMFSSCSNNEKLDKIERQLASDENNVLEIVEPVVALPDFCLYETRTNQETEDCLDLLVEQFGLKTSQ